MKSVILYCEKRLMDDTKSHKKIMPVCRVMMPLIILSVLYFTTGKAYPSDPALKLLLKKISEAPVPEYPTEKITSKNDILYCTGTHPVAVLNNRAADLISKGKYPEAEELLKEGLIHAPLFFPFRYNLGVCNIFQNKLVEAQLHLEKAVLIVPEYPTTYLQIGYIYSRWGKDSVAIEYFRRALQRNSEELRALIYIGDIYFSRSQYQRAQKYYEASLKINPQLPDGLLGLAKILFKKEEYYKSMVLLKSINQNIDYDKSLHYYFAECAFKMNDYRTAYQQYTMLLKYKTDRFFLTHSLAIIRHKLDISRRFVESQPE